MVVWRICSRPYASFDGAGARIAGGRWNLPGHAVIYTSATVSLAALEFLVHLERSRKVRDLVLTSAEIPDEVRIDRLYARKLPASWRETLPAEEIQRIGARWIVRCASAVLEVPSAVILQESNYLLNPAHPDFPRIRVRGPAPFSFDPRVL